MARSSLPSLFGRGDEALGSLFRDVEKVFEEFSRRPVLLNIGKCLTFRFLLHRGRFHGSPGTDVSAFLSAGCHRGTRGEVHQVDCRVAIPIVDDTAFNA